MKRTKVQAKVQVSSKIPRGISAIVIVAVLIAAVFMVGENIDKGKLSMFKQTVRNEGDDGYSVFYKALEELQVPVKIDSQPIEKEPQDALVIVVESDYIDEDALDNWVDEGGSVFYLSDEYEGQLPYMEVSDQEKGKWIDIYGKKALSNKNIWKDTTLAYEVYTEIARSGKTVIFNEYYIMDHDQKQQVWMVLPVPIKVMFIQCMIGVICYFLYAGKRFGKPERLPEEEERTENEYIYAAAMLYKKSQAWDLALKSYYDALKNSVHSVRVGEDDLMSIWHQEALPSEEVVREVMLEVEHFLGNAKEGKKLKRKEVLPILEKIEYLISIVDKRREQYWRH